MTSITIGTVCFLKDPSHKKILLLKRKKEPLSGLYTGVGGKTHFEEDIYTSCLREIKEETSLSIPSLKLSGILKTLLENKDSSWILFVYTATCLETPLPPCNEGELLWASYEEAKNLPLIGFIKEIFSYVLEEHLFFEGTFIHDQKGSVITKNLKFLPFF